MPAESNIQPRPHVRKLIERSTKHGMATNGKLPIYSVWLSMKARCYNPKDRYYSHYGGRGIKVCQGWINSPLAFSKQVGERPSLKHSIDRIENDGNYSCGKCEECTAKGWTMNVRWATPREQAGNRRNNVWLELNGERHILWEWARIRGIPVKTLEMRKRRKWSDERALTTPVSTRL